jgi:hypothetical protein
MFLLPVVMLLAAAGTPVEASVSVCKTQEAATTLASTIIAKGDTKALMTSYFDKQICANAVFVFLPIRQVGVLTGPPPLYILKVQIGGMVTDQGIEDIDAVAYIVSDSELSKPPDKSI